jgi:Domain of unknown function (DUF4124)
MQWIADLLRTLLALWGGAFPIPQAAAESIAAHAIYRCKAAGQITFSDRPCSADAEVHEVAGERADPARAEQPTVAATRPARTAGTAKDTPRRRRSAKPSADAARAKQVACDGIESRLREVRSKMRSGYGAQEGERLRERQKALQERRRAMRCR